MPATSSGKLFSLIGAGAIICVAILIFLRFDGVDDQLPDIAVASAGVAPAIVPRVSNAPAAEQPESRPPFNAVETNAAQRASMPLMDRILTPKSEMDEIWMVSVGYPKIQDIDGPVTDDALKAAIDDFENRGPDAYSASVLAARLFRRNDEAWKMIARRYAEISPFLARLELEFELSQTRPDRLSVADLNNLAIRAMLLGDTEVGQLHSRSFDRVAWQVLATRISELDTANQMLRQYGRQSLPIAIRPSAPPNP